MDPAAKINVGPFKRHDFATTQTSLSAPTNNHFSVLVAVCNSDKPVRTLVIVLSARSFSGV
jgi:hypothetical protein